VSVSCWACYCLSLPGFGRIVALLFYFGVSWLFGVAVALHTPPRGVPSDVARRGHADVGAVDVRSLSPVLMFHSRSLLHVGRAAAVRRTGDAACRSTAPGSTTDMTVTRSAD